MRCEIRPATIDDYDAIFDLWNSTEQSSRALNPVDDSREGIDKYLKRNPNTCFAAVKGDQIIGVILTGHDGRRGMIHHFLIRAKQATYAGKGAETTPSREKSHDLIYRDGDYMYYDTYLGTAKFAGEEALWIKNTPFWSMNYIGRVTGHPFSGDFLKEALLLVPEEKPFRGPESYSNGDYTYHCEIDGTFEWFHGKETICYNGMLVYECIFHGGLIE